MYSISVSAYWGVDEVLIAENNTLQQCGLIFFFSFKYPNFHKINIFNGFHITVLHNNKKRPLFFNSNYKPVYWDRMECTHIFERQSIKMLLGVQQLANTG